MELSPEDRERIWAEEKARCEAREQWSIERSRRPVGLRGALAVIFFTGCLVTLWLGWTGEWDPILRFWLGD